MSILKLKDTDVDQTVEALKGISAEQMGKIPVELSFQGDLSITESGDDLRDLMEGMRILWFNAANYEASLLGQIQETILSTDKDVAEHIGNAHE